MVPPFVGITTPEVAAVYVSSRYSVGSLTAPPQRQGPDRCHSGSALFCKRGRVRWRCVLGPGPRALAAITSRLVPFVSALFFTVRVAVRDWPFASSERFLRLRWTSADVQYPTPLTCQNRTDMALEFPSAIVALRCLFLHSFMRILSSLVKCNDR